MANIRKCTCSDAEFQQAVAECLSVRQVLSRIGLVPAGGNYKTVHARVARLGLDTSHWTGAAWNQGERFRAFGTPFCWDDILVENSTYASTFRLRKRLIEYGLKEHRCEACTLSEWLGEPIPLELHHVNGVNNDHRLENLQLLCPNCHALTDNYRGKNQKRKTS
ncbi:HNH endonuclease signature motif containing protein [Hymenobacter actinosclerus]|uniref:HNH nuclease domain-containing protein n=1 Tax=Hymenobacter actinosclerus TaxID=82805 RepID=A0A1H9ZJQ1_9BACT|nr:HNH endonuclease signature motif containing protein [Hymenobacter actinosclerus]SES81878.1 hypothetical protein SAMN04487998_0362 [Hymenobacter actinosclerus]